MVLGMSGKQNILSWNEIWVTITHWGIGYEVFLQMLQKQIVAVVNCDSIEKLTL